MFTLVTITLGHCAWEPRVNIALVYKLTEINVLYAGLSEVADCWGKSTSTL